MKARFLWTNGRTISQQLSTIERQQHRIKTIRKKLHGSSSQVEEEETTSNPSVQYNMGKLEKFPVHIPTFLQTNEGDPAVKVDNPSLQLVSADVSITELLFEIERASTSLY